MIKDKEPPLWDYRYRFIILLVLLAIILVLGICLTSDAKSLTEGKEWLVEPSSWFLEPITPHYVPYVETYGALIDRLVKCESGGNPEALGDDGRAKSILQFHEPTFKRYCVDRYNLPNDIWDPEIQRECCDRMLVENFDNVAHWTCYRITH